MKKFTFLTGLMMVAMLMMAGNVFAQYSGGSGTSGDPYQINTTDDLIELSNTPGDWWGTSAYFIQTADIAFAEDETQVDWDGDGTLEHSDDEDDTYGFSPIGTAYMSSFKGSYDGQNHTIDNLYINRPETNNIGLFGYQNGTSVIRNLGIQNANIT